MKLIQKFLLSIFLCVFVACTCPTHDAKSSQENTNDTIVDFTSDTVCINGFPALGKWMYQADKQRAHWLGVKYMNKNLIEPINIILIDSISKSSAEAKQRLVSNLVLAKYTSRPMHSGGYFGFIDSVFYPQLPAEKSHAFSNHSALINNNHARVFGPHFYKDVYLFVAALSRENIAPLDKVKHSFASFNKARNEFANSMDKRSHYKITDYLDMHNSIVNDSLNGTADHDGISILLKLQK